MLHKIRLGKRSPLGALVSSTCHSPDQVTQRDPEGCVASVAMAMGPGPQAVGRIKLNPGQKVYLLCRGHEHAGVVEQHNHVDDQVSIFLPILGQHVVRKTEDVRTSPSTPPLSSSLSSTDHQTSGRPHTVSSCVDVPRRRSPEEVDMDEMMAAMVLTSLSCSPLLHSPPHRDIPAVPDMECGGGDLSDSGSSGYWSVGHGNGSPAPSPPITDSEGSLVTPSDEGLDMELEQVLFDEPAPRRRRNSVKVAYRCLWPSCGKTLTSVVGIKRHVRTLHLGQNSDHERCSRSEEDFYYTEIHQKDQQARTLPPTLSFSPLSVPSMPCHGYVPSPPSPPHPACGSQGVGTQPGAGGVDLPTDGPPLPIHLSHSAPSSSGIFWQVQSEHSYQAPTPVPVLSPAAANATSSQWTTPTTGSQSRQGASFRVRSVSVGEQWLQQQSAPIRTNPSSFSPPRSHGPARRVRGEAKKCRKVYGIEHRDQWCTACRWKKACQRFLD
ncbi:zinc finger protein 395a isoform X2 [Lampris incognitus]|uniref:zinc finger protein 395a isoform X2 n=1 Tax=Lampris incognitus TaxID=2546036 RepID=UPI0024B48D3C|nr:zinc finger protein 395a isoform X2 [Lampris incognitus]